VKSLSSVPVVWAAASEYSRGKILCQRWCEIPVVSHPPTWRPATAAHAAQESGCSLNQTSKFWASTHNKDAEMKKFPPNKTSIFPSDKPYIQSKTVEEKLKELKP